MKKGPKKPDLEFFKHRLQTGKKCTMKRAGFDMKEWLRLQLPSMFVKHFVYLFVIV